MGLVVRVALAIVLVLALSNCRYTQPIQNVVDNPIPREMHNLPMDAIETQIIAGGTNGPWRVQRVTPGKLSGSLLHAKHGIQVDIVVTQQNYSILHVSTTNLLENDDEVHQRYNRWLRGLQKNIDTQLARYAAGIRG